MLRLRWGTVAGIIEKEEERWLIKVLVGNEEADAVLYPRLTGTTAPGDQVLLNTTAVFLKLGTGGYHFVLSVAQREQRDIEGPGHIIKLRYTPYQIRVNAREEQGTIKPKVNPVVVAASLHSMVPPLVLALHHLGISDISFLMTDGGALPIWFSDVIRKLKERGLVKLTITAGHAFGGDLETVNTYTGILAAAERGSFVVIAGPGPGHVGTGSKFGFSGIEQGEVLNAAGVLGFSGVGLPRVSFADPRPRHRGISHHSLTSLGLVCRDPVTVVLPELNDPERVLLQKQAGVLAGKRILYLPLYLAQPILEQNNELLCTMGRPYQEDPVYFGTCSLAAWAIKDLLKEGRDFGGQTEDSEENHN